MLNAARSCSVHNENADETAEDRSHDTAEDGSRRRSKMPGSFEGTSQLSRIVREGKAAQRYLKTHGSLEETNSSRSGIVRDGNAGDTLEDPTGDTAEDRSHHTSKTRGSSEETNSSRMCIVGDGNADDTPEDPSPHDTAVVRSSHHLSRLLPLSVQETFDILAKDAAHKLSPILQLFYTREFFRLSSKPMFVAVEDPTDESKDSPFDVFLLETSTLSLGTTSKEGTTNY